MTYISFKYKIAFVAAILFHFFGAIGIVFWDRNWFVSLTPLNLLLMAFLIIWTQQHRNRAFFSFMFIAVLTGIIAEVIGVNYGFLFGNYRYGTTLGLSFFGVPLILGVNWFIIIYCIGMIMERLHRWTQRKMEAANATISPVFKTFSFIVDGALLATFFDWILEPVAIKLGFWSWLGDGSVPFFNYVSWFIISALLLFIFRLFHFNKHNYFAVHLFIIQFLFFLFLRTFL
jgi:putative membrane protein